MLHLGIVHYMAIEYQIRSAALLTVINAGDRVPAQQAPAYFGAMHECYDNQQSWLGRAA